MLRDFLLGFIKIHILYHAAKEPVYGAALIAELKRHGYEVSPGTLYPILHGLSEAGYLAVTSRTVAGKVRKYYRITPRGRAALAEVRPRILELVQEVVHDVAPRSIASCGGEAREAEGSGAHGPPGCGHSSRTPAGPRIQGEGQG